MGRALQWPRLVVEVYSNGKAKIKSLAYKNEGSLSFEKVIEILL
jgi:hypothetical protein